MFFSENYLVVVTLMINGIVPWVYTERRQSAPLFSSLHSLVAHVIMPHHCNRQTASQAVRASVILALIVVNCYE